MPPGGKREGAGRPRGSRDSPLVLGRTLALDEIKAVDEDCQVIRARTRLAAWESLAKQVEGIGTLPQAGQVMLIALVLKYAEPTAPTAVAAVQVNVQDGGPRPSEVLRQRLADLAG